MNRLTSRHLIEKLTSDQAARVERLDRPPSLAVILPMGETGVHAASEKYVLRKTAHARQVGVDARVFSITQPEIPSTMARLQSQALSGLMLQLPLPNPDETDRLCSLIPEKLDVDGLRPDSPFDTPTAKAMMAMAEETGIEMSDQRIVVVGACSRVAGASLARILQREDLDPILIDPRLPKQYSLKHELAKATLVFSSVGKPGLIAADMLPKHPVTLVDAGVKIVEGKAHGDLESAIFDLERDDVSATPPIGAVGPLTVTELIGNVIDNAEETQATAA